MIALRLVVRWSGLLQQAASNKELLLVIDAAAPLRNRPADILWPEAAGAEGPGGPDAAAPVHEAGAVEAEVAEARAEAPAANKWPRRRGGCGDCAATRAALERAQFPRPVGARLKSAQDRLDGLETTTSGLRGAGALAGASGQPARVSRRPSFLGDCISDSGVWRVQPHTETNNEEREWGNHCESKSSRASRRTSAAKDARAHSRSGDWRTSPCPL